MISQPSPFTDIIYNSPANKFEKIIVNYVQNVKNNSTLFYILSFVIIINIFIYYH